MQYKFLKNFKQSAVNKIIKISRPYTSVKLIHNALENVSKGETKLKKYVSQGNILASYIPFIHRKTAIVVGNFLSINYGIRSDISYVVALVDKNFQVKAAKLYKLNLRQILFLSSNDFADFETENDPEIEYCIVCAINKSIPKNHAGTSELRFWGVWNEFSSYVHSFPLPSPIAFLRQRIGKLNAIPLEAMTYPLSASNVFHYGAFSDKLEIKERGDLSGKIYDQYGFTLLLDKKMNITSCFHNRPFDRKIRFTDKNIQDIVHIIPIPPLEGIDMDIFFGGVCSDGSTFKASLWQKKDEYSTPECIEETQITISSDNSMEASKIFDKKISNNKTRWIKFTPLSGLHDICFVSLVYKNMFTNEIFDGVHSQTFKNNPGELEKLKKISSRSLKFAPFSLNQSKNSFALLTVLGEWRREINVRIRIFSAADPSYETVFIEKIFPQEVKYINLIEKISPGIQQISHDNLFVCQVESEEANLDGYLMNVKGNKTGINKLSVDHLTGG